MTRHSGMTRRGALVLMASLLAAACTGATPEPIAFDADGCAFCRMQISDRRFGAVILTKRGRTIKFDSVECLVSYYRKDIAARDVASVWVSDFLHPRMLLNAASAQFVDLGAGRAPMGGTRGIAAVAASRDAAAIGATATRHWTELL
jgi:copper chaperone NosL